MRAYECVFILIPSLGESEIDSHVDRFAEIITSRGGKINKREVWGKRKLAYEIKDHTEGIYTLFKFEGNNEILDELKRVFKFDDVIVRHMILLDDNPLEEQAEPESSEVTER